MSSEAITRNDLSSILNAVIHGKPSEFRKLLWENPSRTSSFAPQTISVNLDGYDEVEVWAIHNINADGSNISNIITRTKVGENATISLTRPDTFLTQDRAFTTSSSGVAFQNCVLGSSASVYNNHSVPVYIYGIKYERVAPPQVDASDYVIEQGTSGVWTYRKWESGIAECWCLTSVVSKSVTTSYGNGYYAPQDTFTLPSGLFVSINNAQVTLIDASASGKWFEVQSANATEIKGYIYGIASDVINAQENICVKGRWK